jgi:hypothetical protein
VNLNDSLHSATHEVQDRFIDELIALYGRIDYLFCGYGVASHFPNCYKIPGKDREATAIRRQAHFNRQWARIVERLAPRYAFPFAADVVFLESHLQWSNEPTHNAERPTDVFAKANPRAATQVLDIAPGFIIESDTIVDPIMRRPLRLADLRRDYAEQVERANTYGTADAGVFDEVLALVRNNVATCAPYLVEYRGDYDFVVSFRNYPSSIAIAKRGSRIEVTSIGKGDNKPHDLRFTTRLHYLRLSLATRYGHEILFVGSGGVFDYRSVAAVRRALHRELAVMLTQHQKAPCSRFGDNSRFMFHVKRSVRALLGGRPHDLYDLMQWTQWLQRER